MEELKVENERLKARVRELETYGERTAQECVEAQQTAKETKEEAARQLACRNIAQKDRNDYELRCDALVADNARLSGELRATCLRTDHSHTEKAGCWKSRREMQEDRDGLQEERNRLATERAGVERQIDTQAKRMGWVARENDRLEELAQRRERQCEEAQRLCRQAVAGWDASKAENARHAERLAEVEPALVVALAALDEAARFGTRAARVAPKVQREKAASAADRVRAQLSHIAWEREHPASDKPAIRQPLPGMSPDGKVLCGICGSTEECPHIRRTVPNPADHRPATDRCNMRRGHASNRCTLAAGHATIEGFPSAGCSFDYEGNEPHLPFVSLLRRAVEHGFAPSCTRGPHRASLECPSAGGRFATPCSPPEGSVPGDLWLEALMLLAEFDRAADRRPAGGES